MQTVEPETPPYRHTISEIIQPYTGTYDYDKGFVQSIDISFRLGLAEIEKFYQPRGTILLQAAESDNWYGITQPFDAVAYLISHDRFQQELGIGGIEDHSTEKRLALYLAAETQLTRAKRIQAHLLAGRGESSSLSLSQRQQEIARYQDSIERWQDIQKKLFELRGATNQAEGNILPGQEKPKLSS